MSVSSRVLAVQLVTQLFFFLEMRAEPGSFTSDPHLKHSSKQARITSIRKGGEVELEEEEWRVGQVTPRGLSG